MLEGNFFYLSEVSWLLWLEIVFLLFSRVVLCLRRVSGALSASALVFIGRCHLVRHLLIPRRYSLHFFPRGKTRLLLRLFRKGHKILMDSCGRCSGNARMFVRSQTPYAASDLINMVVIPVLRPPTPLFRIQYSS